MFIKRFRMAYQNIWRIFLHIILALVGKLEIEGTENIPSSGNYIAVTNHLSKVDPPIIMLTLPKQPMRVFAAKKWQKNPLFGPILSLAGAIWVLRGQVDRQALREAVKCLKDGQVLGMAPEGTRSRTGALQKARQGAAYLADRAGVPLLPVGIANSDQFLGNLRKLRRTRFQVRIGKPILLPDLGRRAKTKELNAFSELIMGHIAQLLPERYRGYYADSPVLSALESG